MQEDASSSSEQPCLVVQPWWMDHLQQPQPIDANDPDPSDGDLRILRWAYGAVVNTTAAQMMERRRELLGGRTADAALMALYEEIAQIWRKLNELGTKKSRLQQLRSAFALLKSSAPVDMHPHCSLVIHVSSHYCSSWVSLMF